MAQLTMQQVTEAIGKMDRHELEELAMAYAISHARMCEVAGHAPSEPRHGLEQAAHGHSQEQQIREKIRSMSTEELVSTLAPVVMVVRKVDEYLT
ncbi:MAG: hypothetical protein ACYC1C_10050 [Chloroflexota bacterium]